MSKLLMKKETLRVEAILSGWLVHVLFFEAQRWDVARALKIPHGPHSVVSGEPNSPLMKVG